MVAIVGAYHAYSFEKEQQCTLFNKYIQSIQAMQLSKQFILRSYRFQTWAKYHSFITQVTSIFFLYVCHRCTCTLLNK